jgi:hypothetical protein
MLDPISLLYSEPAKYPEHAKPKVLLVFSITESHQQELGVTNLLYMLRHQIADYGDESDIEESDDEDDSEQEDI